MSVNQDSSFDMNTPDGNSARFEEQLRSIAAALPYPPAPDLAGRERQRLARRPAARRTTARRITVRRPAVVLALLAFILAAALLVSPVRARVLDWIRIGAVRIFFNVPTPASPAPTAPAAPAADPPLPSGTPSPVITPSPTPTPLQSVLDLSGETTLARAQEQVDFTIQFPTYPDDLGQPEHVYLQPFENPVVMLVWMDPSNPGQVAMTLSETTSVRAVFEKYDPVSVLETQVNGRPAVWVEGDYHLIMRGGDSTMSRLIRQGHTLIWTEGALTFRLETDVELAEAVRIAESLR